MNEVASEWVLKWLAPKFWPVFGEKVNVLAESNGKFGELVQVFVHFLVVGMRCKIDK